MKIFVAYFLSNLVAASILRNQTNIYCPFQEPYIIPPVKASNDLEYLSATATWTSDWNITKSSTFLVGPVLDMRWGDLKINYGKVITHESFHALSLSILGPFTIRIFNNERNYRNSKKVEIAKSAQEWVHYTFVSENHSLSLYENDKLLRSWHLINEQITNVTIMSKTDIYWKLHEYEFKSATTETKDKPTTLILPSQTSCLTIYTILCPTCYLEVFLNNRLILNITSYNSSTIMKTWQSQRLEAEFKQQDRLSFYRRKIKNNSDAFWNLDVTFCSPDFATYVLNGSTDNYRCHGLNDPNITEDDYFAFCDEPGKIGRSCERNCSQILGQDYPYCEDHKSCRGETCVCSWGYTGNNCTEACREGKWGLECSRNCTECERCDNKNGTCISQNDSHQAQIITIIIIVAICLLGIILSVVVCIPYWNRISNKLYGYVKVMIYE